MAVSPFPRLETVAPSRSALRELVRQLKQRYPSLRDNSITLGYGIHPRDMALLNDGYRPSDGAACRFIMAIVDAVPDPPSDGSDPVALFARTLREAPKRIGENHKKT